MCAYKKERQTDRGGESEGGVRVGGREGERERAQDYCSLLVRRFEGVNENSKVSHQCAMC